MSDPVDEIRLRYSTIFNRLDRYTPAERAEVIWAAVSQWCMGCGLSYDECWDVPEPGNCCGVATRTVRAEQCPECESIASKTIRPVGGEFTEEDVELLRHFARHGEGEPGGETVEMWHPTEDFHDLASLATRLARALGVEEG